MATLKSHSAGIYLVNLNNDRPGGEPIFWVDAHTAPHICADYACPGNINRRKLAAFEQLENDLNDLRVKRKQT